MGRWLRLGSTAVFLLVVAPTAGAGQGPAPIQDNSFLVEEAYNQEPGVVQHIGTLSRADDGGSWVYTFTQEWPVGGRRHQVSYTVPLSHTNGNGAGIGDVALNYRYQLRGEVDDALLVAPRATLLLPTGSEAKGRGAGAAGVQANLPVSYTLLPRLIVHANAGGTATYHARTEVNLGASAVWLVRPAFNILLEGVWLAGRGESVFLNPGVRWALDFASGLQVVPGLAYTVGVGPSRGDNALFLYLSFEHPFRRR